MGCALGYDCEQIAEEKKTDEGGEDAFKIDVRQGQTSKVAPENEGLKEMTLIETSFDAKTEVQDVARSVSFTTESSKEVTTKTTSTTKEEV